MGKISPPSIKYIIKAKFTAEGVIEKPDVIGAIFGQSEGLLGEELELRDLQKKGKIGRIEADLKVEDSKTIGVIEIPTSIDKTETTIIAAAVETIDRVGPCDAKFEILDIEDVRTSKRQYIVDRAKALLEKLSSKMPEMREMETEISNHNKTAKVIEYGEDKLTAGPDVETSQEVIVVEGRADVLNLLRMGIKNVIAMNGAVVPKTIKQLGDVKDLIFFVDGDRGGLLNMKDAITTTRIKAIARAPDGKEVEELAEKEVLSCLRSASSVEEFRETYFKRRGRKKQDEGIGDTRRTEYRERRPRESEEQGPDVDINLDQVVKEMSGSKSCAVVLANGRIFRKSINEAQKFLYHLEKRGQRIQALVIDGTLSNSVLAMAERLGCKTIAAKNFASTSEKIKFLSF